MHGNLAKVMGLEWLQVEPATYQLDALHIRSSHIIANNKHHIQQTAEVKLPSAELAALLSVKLDYLIIIIIIIY